MPFTPYVFDDVPDNEHLPDAPRVEATGVRAETYRPYGEYVLEEAEKETTSNSYFMGYLVTECSTATLLVLANAPRKDEDKCTFAKWQTLPGFNFQDATYHEFFKDHPCRYLRKLARTFFANSEPWSHDKRQAEQRAGYYSFIGDNSVVERKKARRFLVQIPIESDFGTQIFASSFKFKTENLEDRSSSEQFPQVLAQRTLSRMNSIDLAYAKGLKNYFPALTVLAHSKHGKVRAWLWDVINGKNLPPIPPFIQKVAHYHTLVVRNTYPYDPSKSGPSYEDVIFTPELLAFKLALDDYSGVALGSTWYNGDFVQPAAMLQHSYELALSRYEHLITLHGTYDGNCASYATRKCSYSSPSSLLLNPALKHEKSTFEASDLTVASGIFVTPTSEVLKLAPLLCGVAIPYNSAMSVYSVVHEACGKFYSAEVMISAGSHPHLWLLKTGNEANSFSGHELKRVATTAWESLGLVSFVNLSHSLCEEAPFATAFFFREEVNGAPSFRIEHTYLKDVNMIRWTPETASTSEYIAAAKKEWSGVAGFRRPPRKNPEPLRKKPAKG